VDDDVCEDQNDVDVHSTGLDKLVYLNSVDVVVYPTSADVYRRIADRDAAGQHELQVVEDVYFYLRHRRRRRLSRASPQHRASFASQQTLMTSLDTAGGRFR